MCSQGGHLFFSKFCNEYAKEKVTYLTDTCTDLKNNRIRVSAHGLPWFIFAGHSLKLPIVVAFTTSWLASLKQLRSLLIRCVKTVFLTSEMFPFPSRQLPWKCVTESTPRSFGPGLGGGKMPQEMITCKSLWQMVSQVQLSGFDRLSDHPRLLTLSDKFGAFPVLTLRWQIYQQLRNFCSDWCGTVC